ncbi:MAG: glucose-6-phosphate isomerase [bacterium]|nr:glucose-6-phosphate isomerase [bacterium]
MTLTASFDDGSLSLDGNLLETHLYSGKVESLIHEVEKAVEKIHKRTGAGSEFLGWLDPSEMLDDKELVRVRDKASRLRAETDTLVVIGIGGSYLGTRACYDALKPLLDFNKKGKGYSLKYAGINLSAQYHIDLLEKLKTRNFAINVISKSGTTTEPGIAFRIFRSELEKSAGKKNAEDKIVATTDRNKGALRELANSEGWETFVVPDDVGGRYSVLTPVGLFPLAYAGVDIDALVGGATEASIACREENLERNPARLYAMFRHLLYKTGLSIELMASFEPRLAQLIEWWKQLYGESEGKDQKGLFPAGAIYSRDLHSLGQWIQDGPRIHFETFLAIEGGEPSLKVPKSANGNSVDELDYLEGRELSEINCIAQEATRAAHADGGCPNMGIYLPKLDEYHLGVLIYFFEYACAISGYLNEINPFNQPGVEVYKKKMFQLLGKPGYEV